MPSLFRFLAPKSALVFFTISVLAHLPNALALSRPSEPEFLKKKSARCLWTQMQGDKGIEAMQAEMNNLEEIRLDLHRRFVYPFVQEALRDFEIGRREFDSQISPATKALAGKYNAAFENVMANSDHQDERLLTLRDLATDLARSLQIDFKGALRFSGPGEFLLRDGTLPEGVWALSYEAVPGAPALTIKYARTLFADSIPLDQRGRPSVSSRIEFHQSLPGIAPGDGKLFPRSDSEVHIERYFEDAYPLAIATTEVDEDLSELAKERDEILNHPAYRDCAESNP